MAELLYLISGTVVLLITIYDFFFTTLSGSGAAFITRFVLQISHNLLQFGLKYAGRQIYSLSGMVVNLMVLGTWVVLVWLGLFLVFSFNPDAIVNSSNISASPIERLYYTGYILSTLGVGNFKPVTPFFELLTSCFSFFGFVFFTTSMTYLISVSSAVIHKRTMALSINNLGERPEEVVKNLMAMDKSYCYQKFSTLQEMIDRHSINHHAYPVLHFYSNPHIASSLSLNLATLDEAVSILLGTNQGKEFHNELLPLRSSLTHFLTNMEQNYSHALHNNEETNINLPQIGKIPEDKSHTLERRRKILDGLLRSEGFGWNDVYPVVNT